MKITPIVINGRHGGLLLADMEYRKTIKLPIEHESQISIGEDYDKSVRIGDYEEYIECFRSVDKKCVMYSTNGKWSDIRYALLSNTHPTHPIDITRISPPIYSN